MNHARKSFAGLKSCSDGNIDAVNDKYFQQPNSLSNVWLTILPAWKEKSISANERD